MTMCRRRLLPWLTILLLLLASGAPAVADAWDDAVREFKRAQRAEEWQVRRDAYLLLLAFDNEDAVEEALDAMEDDDNMAVVLAGIEGLALVQSEEAIAALVDEADKGRGDASLYAFLALADRDDDRALDVMRKTLGGRDEIRRAQAALSLGRLLSFTDVPAFLALLEEEDWQLRAAGARALRLLAGPVPEEEPGKPSPPWLPEAYPVDEVLPPLIAALERAEGAERGDVIEALERITRQDFGWDVAAWKALAAGEEPDAIRRAPRHPPYAFGMPIHGQRVVIVFDHSLCTDDPHPFTDRARLQELCEVPGARSVPWYELRTTKQFTTEWVKRLINDLSSEARFDLVTLGGKVGQIFGRLTPVNAGTRAKAIEELVDLEPTNVVDTLTAFQMALDIAGAKDSRAWSKGPDEVLFMSCSVPWLADVTDQERIGARIGLKARLRMVPVRTVGVGPHPFVLMRRISEMSGGTYLDLSR